MDKANTSEYVCHVYTAHLYCVSIYYHNFLAELLTPAFSTLSVFQWKAMPSDTNGVESLNKCSIDKSKKSKSLESCLDLTYRQDKKMTYEHLFVHSGLPISFQKKTVETMKKCALRQNKARCKRILSQANEDEDDIGLKGDTCKNYVNKSS